MDRLIGAWDGAAETAIRNRHLDEPTQTMHEYIDAEKDKCWSALARAAGQTFTDPTKAMLFKTEFEAKCYAVQAEARPGQQRAPRRTRTHWL